jgi:hypothetical protein
MWMMPSWLVFSDISPSSTPSCVECKAIISNNYALIGTLEPLAQSSTPACMDCKVIVSIESEQMHTQVPYVHLLLMRRSCFRTIICIYTHKHGFRHKHGCTCIETEYAAVSYWQITVTNNTFPQLLGESHISHQRWHTQC